MLDQLGSKELLALHGEKAKRSFRYFVEYFWKLAEPTSPFVPGLHIDAIIEHLEHIKELRNLLICIPPRHTKSILADVMFPCWQWTHDPTSRFVCASYAASLSERDSVKCRDIIQAEQYKSAYRITLKDDQNQKAKFQNNFGGFRLATSVEGSVTGEGGEFIICDDPHKISEKDSKATRESVVRWFFESFANRLNDPATGCRIVVLQRCHSEDLAGAIIANDKANNWTKLILPLEYKQSVSVPTKLGWKDPRTREGELLCPERLPPNEVAFLKSTLGNRGFQSQYNQCPLANDASLFNLDNIQDYEPGEPPADSFRIVAVDLAISTKTTADYTAIVVADCDQGGNIFVRHVLRERLGGPRIVPTLDMINQTFRPLYMLIEDVAFQRLVIEECRVRGMPVKGVKTGGADKESRSIPLQVKVENKQLFLPTEATWRTVLEDELMEFPGGRHDDICDALAYLCIEAGKRTRTITRTQAPTEDQDQEALWARRYQELAEWGTDF